MFRPFAMQIARIEAGLAPPAICVGKLDAERDFLDARDVASAYARVALNSHDLVPNTIFNVAFGISRRMGDILDQLLARSSVKSSRSRTSCGCGRVTYRVLWGCKPRPDATWLGA